MTDVITKQPLRVAQTGTVGPYVIVPLDQLPTLKALLDRHRVSYWVHENAISLDGRNYTIVVDFARDAEPAKVQAILDAAA